MNPIEAYCSHQYLFCYIDTNFCSRLSAVPTIESHLFTVCGSEIDFSVFLNNHSRTVSEIFMAHESAIFNDRIIFLIRKFRGPRGSYPLETSENRTSLFFFIINLIIKLLNSNPRLDYRYSILISSRGRGGVSFVKN